ncbi:2-keto-4-pentenoate hydratase [Aurantiacibacter marinus]|uniref:2-keto-4-pentenoate hydratase n=1 Tax=Aurantiacibacter marinus TaxID=874156 RepID=A0A0H0XXN6_9SPHN|nr:hypothetical protein [Aurantiacibacter marinus]KLI65065.1 hypothetical protein AAV99_06335 [Aurantiacibacter marinus]
MSDTIPTALREISQQLTSARAQARALPGFPDGQPDTLEDAYRVQDISIAAWDDDVVGWKVGGVPASYQDRFSDKRLVGPVFRKLLRYEVAGERVPMPAFAGGFAAIEPEFIFELGATPAEDRMYIGVEIASSPVPSLNDYGPTAIICDFGNQNGLLIGPEVPDWQNRSADLRVTAEIDGTVVGDKTLTDFPRDALAAVDFLREVSARRGYSLPAGTLVSSGAITGVHDAEVGARSRLDFGELGVLELELVPATAQI